MVFVELSRSHQIKIEVYCAALLVLLAFAFSPPFWLEAVLGILLSAVVAHLILSLSSVIQLTRAFRGVMVAGALTILLVLMWLHTRSASEMSSGPVVAGDVVKASGSVQAFENSVRGNPSSAE